MKSIWKYELKVVDQQSIKMPVGAEMLTVKVQNNVPCLYCMVDIDNEREFRGIRTFGTGHNSIENEIMSYVGTYQLPEHGLVFHVFDCDL